MPPIKMIFKDEFPLERITLKGDIKAPPMTKHYSLVGTAFDYLLRFYLEKENPNCVTEPWVAESAVPLLNAADKLKNDVAVSTEDLKYIQTAVMLEQSSTRTDLARTSKTAGHLLDEAKNSYEMYLRAGDMSDSLISSSIILAQMDVPYRAGRLPSDFGHVNPDDIKDLRNLISLADPRIFKAKNACYLNPTFGYGSNLVGGADADVIVDGTLIDIKTVKTLKFTREMYNQLIGYYVLAKLGKVGGNSDVQISRLGVYFSRYGVLHLISAEQIENNPGFPRFVMAFEKMAQALFGTGDTQKN